MKNKIYVGLISIAAISLLVVSFLFAINYKKESENYFYESGYILSNNYESGSENVSKLYFDTETSYKNNKNNEYTFENSEGEKVNVSEESFVHYSNGSIMSLKKGVAIDLNDIDSKLISYYNIFEGSVLTKKNEVYEIANLDDKITFAKLMFKISDEKYLIAAPKIIISFSDDQTVEMENYVEIEYVSENVIRVYNDKVNYQTIASKLYVIVDDIGIDLEYKSISKKGKKYLTMADMVINSDDNIEVLPQPEEIKDKEEDKNQNNSSNNQGGASNNQGGQSNNAASDGGTVDSDVQQGLDNLIQNLPTDNEQVDTENEFIQPKFKIESMNVTTLGFENLNISFEDESSVLYGDRTVEIIENSTGKVVQQLANWQEGSQSYTVNSLYDLKPNTEYTLNVTGKYKIDETIFDRNFVSKIFRTLDIGLEIMEDYISSDSLSFAVYRNSYSETTGFSYEITDKNGHEIVKLKEVKFDDENVVVITEQEKFKPNTEYILTIKDIKYGNRTLSTLYYKSLKITYKTKTLKSNPFRNSDVNLTSKINNRENTITLNIEGINDLYGGIKNYTYNIYNAVGDLKYTVTKEKAESLTFGLDLLSDEDEIYFNVEVNYDDNEKTIMFVSQNSKSISISGVQYPKIVEFKQGTGEADAQSIIGNLIIDDEGDFISSNGISKYKVDIKENNNSSLGGKQQFINTIKTEMEKTDSRIPLTVIFEGLKPETEYVLYAYLWHGEEYIYLGYEVVKTNTAAPIYLNFFKEETQKSGENLFDFKIKKEANSTSDKYINELKLDLYGCSKTNNECLKLDFTRTVPKDQNNYDELHNAMKYNPEKEISETNKVNEVYVTSNEFYFTSRDYAKEYEYKIVASGKALGYDIPIKINGKDSNEFKIEFNDVDPLLELNGVNISKEICEETNGCRGNYIEENSKLDDKTIVGVDLEIIDKENPMGEKIDNISYEIYENPNNLSCEMVFEEEANNENPNIILQSNVVLEEIKSNPKSIFIPLGNSDNDIKLKRGKRYCLKYYGTYKSEITKENQEKEIIEKVTTPKSTKIEIEKQEVKINGYINGYDGNSLKVKLDINDIDSSLVPNSLKLVNNISNENISPSLENNVYTFEGIKELNYLLMLKMKKFEEEIDKNIQEIRLDSIISDGMLSSNAKISIIVDPETNPGEISIKIPRIQKGNNINDYINRIAGIAIESKNGSHQYLSLNNNGEYLYTKITLDSIRNQSIGTITQNGDKYFWEFESIKLIYDSGKIVDYEGNNKRLFVVNKSSLATTREYYNTGKIFEPIKLSSILNSSTLNEYGTFIKKDFNSSAINSKIGVSLIKSETSSYPVYFNEVAYGSSILYDKSDKIITENKIEIKDTISTSEIETKYKSSGAKIKFRITNEVISEDTLLQIVLKQGENNFDPLNLIYKNGKWSSISETSKIKQITGQQDQGDKDIIVEFLDLEDEGYTYSINYNLGTGVNATYNVYEQRANKDIEINAMKAIELISNSSSYVKNNWSWSGALEMNSPQKYIMNVFDVKESIYELNEGEEIKYSIVIDATDESGILEARRVFEGEEKLVLEGENSIQCDFTDFFTSGYEQYTVKILPFIVNGNNDKKTLTEYVLKTHEITANIPGFYVSNNKKTDFNISLQDQDVVLVPCDENKISEIYKEKEPIGFPIQGNDQDNQVENYFAAKRFKSNSVYFELYQPDEQGDKLVGYSPIPFPYESVTLKLGKALQELGYFNGLYKVKIKYCMFGKDDVQTFTHDNVFTIQSLSSFKLFLLDAGNSYLLAFENPIIEKLDEINRIVYQITDINGETQTYEKSNLDAGNTNNDIKLVGATIADQPVYYTNLDIKIPTHRVRSIVVNIYSGLDEESIIGNISK